MRILVTGGAGYLGSHIMRRLHHSGHTAVSLDNLSNGNAWALKWGVSYCEELCNENRLVEILKAEHIDHVIHCAASAYVAASMSEPAHYFRNNVVNTMHLLNAMCLAGVYRIVLASSCAVYGVPRRTHIDESHTLKPINPYGESKLMAETLLRSYARTSHLRWVALRYFNIAGASYDGEIGEAHHVETHAIPRALMAAGGLVPYFEICGLNWPTADGTTIRDYIHVEDVVSANMRALAYLEVGNSGDVFNIGSGMGSSVQDIVRSTESVCGVDLKILKSSPRDGDPSILVADVGRARERLGWKPEQSDLASIIASAWSWLKVHRHG